MSNAFPLEFERAVIRALVQDKQFLKEAIPVARPEYMADGALASSLKVVIAAYLRTKEPPSKVGFLSELMNEERRRIRVKKSDEDQVLVEPCRAVTEDVFKPMGDLADVKFKFLDFCRQREMENGLLSAYDKLTKGEMDVSAAADSVKKIQQRVNAQAQGGRDFFLDIDELPQILTKIQENCLTTGFKTLDKKMGGGMGRGTLTTFVAPAKGGKSMTLLNVGYANMLRGKKVMYFTLEIDEERIIKRFASRISKKPQDVLREKAKDVIEDLAKFWDFTKSSLKVKEFMHGATTDTLRSYLYWLESEKGWKPDLVLVDYGDLVRPGTKQKELRHDQREAYTELRALMKEFNVAGATASQCNREAMNKIVIRMQDVAEAIDKCMISDHIVTACRTEEEECEKKMRLFFAGSREGESGGQIALRYDWTVCSMFESNDPIKHE